MNSDRLIGERERERERSECQMRQERRKVKKIRNGSEEKLK